LAAFPACAELRLPSLFADGMVLQQNQPVPVWGWAAPGAQMTVAFHGESVQTIAGEDGRWRVALPRLSAKKKPGDLRIDGSSGGRAVVRNVLVGDVWLCSGPSNIFWPVAKCDHAAEEIAQSHYPELRFFMVERDAADEPREDCAGTWTVCGPETVGAASGIAYFFARRIHQATGIPIGVLQSFWGGSRMEAWTSMEALEAAPGAQPVLAAWASEEALFGSGAPGAAYEQELERWQEEVAQAAQEGRKAPAKPRPPEEPATSRHRPSCLYNGMIAPLIPYGIRGALTYQGNGNLVRSQHSTALLTTQIQDWRARWGLGPIPFGLVQPAPFDAKRWKKSRGDAYSLLREAQLTVLERLPNVGLALTMDVDAIDDLHFPNKQIVGGRMARWALNEVYGQPVSYAGPVYEGMQVEGSRVRIRFKHTGDGLSTSDGKAPAHFAVAGPDGAFRPA